MTILNRIDVSAEINACDCIWAFDERRLDLELRKTGLDPVYLPLRLEALLGVAAPASDSDGAAFGPAPPARRENAARHAALGILTHAPQGAPAITASALVTQEFAGPVKFYNSAKGYGFFVIDGTEEDVMVHISVLEAAGFRAAYEGARIHALVQRTDKGLQAVRILSMDESQAVHPSQLAPRTREAVRAQSEWVPATTKFYDRLKGYGFVRETPDSPECFLHADTLRRWGMPPLRPGQVVEIRWGMSSKGRMVAEIRHADGAPTLPQIH